MNDVEKLREKIDRIDDRIAALFDERMDTVRKIGEAKAESGIPVSDAEREKKIINRVTAEVGDDRKIYLKQIYEKVFDVSKAYQTRYCNVDSSLGKEIRKAIESTGEEFPSSATVACQGVAGAYSMLACERLFPISEILYFKDWNGVFGAIENGLCRYGILPIENSSAGSVNAVYDLIQKHKFYIVRTVKLKVKHSLLAKNGTSLENVREIFSHGQAISQCSEFLKKYPWVKITEAENTAVAAKTIAESGRTDAAAIASPECADIYGLKPLKNGIQNVDNNYTRFICISKELEIYPNADKISVVLSLPHVTGSLNKVLSRFSALGLNLTKIESRPIASSEFEFAFYFDFEGDVRKREVYNLLSEMYNSLEYFAFLGCYREVG
ncbi:MAG: chorismate mutase [Clostridia bacterium]|nr:chorismate mutase [Clostridia bacterium]